MKPRLHPLIPRSHWPLLAPTLGLLAGVLGAALMFAPARLLAWSINQASGERVVMSQARGTVWQGQAALTLSAGPGSRERLALPAGVAWQLRPGWQAGPVLHWQLRAPCCERATLSGRVRGLGRMAQVELDDGSSRWPIDWLAGLGTPWNTLALQGQLELHPRGLRWSPGAPGQPLSGSLELRALDLTSALSTLRPLGSYALRLEGSGGSAGTRLELSTLQGALQLSAQGQWRGGQLQLRGLAEAPPERVDALSNLLNILGRRDGRRAHLNLG